MKSNKVLDWYLMNMKYFPLVIIAFFLPLMIYYSYYEAPQSVIDIMHMTTNGKLDMYTLGKSYLLNFSGFLMIAYAIYSYKNKSRESLISFRIEYKILALMFLMILLSTVFSEYKEVALYGFAERYEGFFVWSIYLITVIYISVFISKVSGFDKIIDVIKCSSIVAAIVGIVEYLGYNIIIQDWFKNIFIQNKLRGIDYTLIYNYDKTIKSTFYNSNFAGGYFAMMSLLFLCALLFNKSKKVFNLLGFTITFVALVGTNSAAGFVAFAVSILFMILINIKFVFRKKGVFLALTFVVFISSAFVWNLSGRGNMIDTELNALKGIKSASESRKQFDELLLNDNIITVGFDGKKIKMKFADNKLQIFDLNDEVLKYKINPNDNSIELKDINYSGIKINVLGEGNILSYTHKNLIFYIGIKSLGVDIFDENGNIYPELNEIRSFGFDGYELIGNSRGYIWSRSLPLLLDNIVIGSGADTFTFYYPQEDIVGKLNFLNDYKIVVDKPHNMFIQMGVSFGMIFILIYIVFVFKYLLESIKLYKEMYEENIKSLLLSVMLVVISFNVTGLFNDTTIATSSIYWLVLGIGIALNKYILNSKEITT